jgi:hypothetical protein
VPNRLYVHARLRRILAMARSHKAAVPANGARKAKHRSRQANLVTLSDLTQCGTHMKVLSANDANRQATSSL